jgi:hypothetical protein
MCKAEINQLSNRTSCTHTHIKHKHAHTNTHTHKHAHTQTRTHIHLYVCMYAEAEEEWVPSWTGKVCVYVYVYSRCVNVYSVCNCV